MFKAIKEKLLTSIKSHPKLVTLGIGLAITFGISLAIGVVAPHKALGRSTIVTVDY
jgi:hypothetical protein